MIKELLLLLLLLLQRERGCRERVPLSTREVVEVVD